MYHQGAKGGIIAFTRLPSARRRIHHRAGLIDPTPDPACDPLHDLNEVPFVVECDVNSLQSASPLDVCRAGTVDHDVCDRRVTHQRLERPQAECLVQDFVDEPLALGQVEQVGALAAQFLRDSPHLQPQLVFLHRADGREVHSGDQSLVKLFLMVKVPLLGRRY